MPRYDIISSPAAELRGNPLPVIFLAVLVVAVAVLLLVWLKKKK